MAFSEAMLFYLGLLFAIPLSLVIGALLGKLFRARWIVLLPPVALLVGAFWAGPEYIQHFGVPTRAALAEHKEIVTVGRNGSWSRNYRLLVNYVPVGRQDSVRSTIGVSRARFDSLQDSMRVNVRYLEQAPGFVQLVGAGTFEGLPDIPDEATGLVTILLLAMPIGVAIWALRPHSKTHHPEESAEFTPPDRRRIIGVRIFAVLWLAGLALFALSTFVEPPVPPLDTEGVAQVKSVDRVTEASSGEDTYDLAQPYDLAKLELTTRRGLHVVAVDAVDAGSVPALVAGTTVPVRYASSDPRTVRMAGGERSHYLLNTISFWKDFAFYVVPVGVGVIYMALFLGRKTRRRRRPVRAA